MFGCQPTKTARNQSKLGSTYQVTIGDLYPRPIIAYHYIGRSQLFSISKEKRGAESCIANNTSLLSFAQQFDSQLVCLYISINVLHFSEPSQCCNLLYIACILGLVQDVMICNLTPLQCLVPKDTTLFSRSRALASSKGFPLPC